MKLQSLIKNFILPNDSDYYPDALVVIDNQNNITCWNKKAVEIFGFSKEQMMGRNIAILFDSETEKIHECCKNNRTAVLASKNNLYEIIYVEISCKIIPDQKKILITLRDVTKNQKVMEKLLIEYETATKINNNKNKFIVGLSTDLKNPLHSLIGFSQGLIDGVCGELTDKQEKYVSIINKNANNLLDIVNDFLELSSLEAGNTEFNMKTFDVVKTLNTICEKIRPESEKKGLQFDSDFNDIVKKNIYSDENMLTLVITAVAENAVKFTEMGSVRVKVLHPDLEILKNQGLEVPENYNDKSYLLFKVTDTGIGLSEEDMGMIFDEYSQTYRTLAKKYGGTGLKLALTRKILCALNGTIWLESEPGQGSTFNFAIPIERPQGKE